MKVKLNSEISIDLPTLIETRLLVQANSGGGKSYAIRRIIEQAFGKVQIIVLDPEGEFVNLRSKYDFVYAGKGGDAPVESRSATLLAHRLLETKASTIIDLYELPPQERKHFVRLFCEAMVNAPKELWHEVLLIIDEAHVFAPEKGESEAMGPVIDLATRGRKRGYCVVLATQRLPKLNKDAAAECNNKLIGRASQDIDRKRAAEELGFTTKEQILSLRDLEPGEFYVFGPAVSREVQKIKIGEVTVKPPLRGSARSFKAPPPSAKVKAILAELVDLPEAAEKEAKTVKELKAALMSTKQELTRSISLNSKLVKSKQEPDPDAIKKLTDKAYALGVAASEHNFKKERDSWKRFKDSLYKRLAPILSEIREEATVGVIKEIFTPPPQRLEKHAEPYRPSPPFEPEFGPGRTRAVSTDEVKLGACERRVYTYLRNNTGRAFTKIQLGVITGYSPTSGGFNNALSKLRTLGLIQGTSGGVMMCGRIDDEIVLPDSNEVFSADPMFWGPKLGACERTIYQFLWNRPTEEFSKEYLAEQTGYSPTSGGFNNALSHLNTLGLIERMPQGMICFNPAIKDL